MTEFNFDFVKVKRQDGAGNAGGAGNVFGGEQDWENINPLTNKTKSSGITEKETIFASDTTSQARGRELTSASDINDNFSAKTGSYGSKDKAGKPEVSSDPKMAKLQEEREVKQQKLTVAQNKYNEVVNGAHTEEIKEAKTTCDEKQEAYLKAVDESQNLAIQAIKEQIEANEKDITSTEQFIQDYTVNIAQTVTDLADNDNKIKAKDSIIGSCKNKIAALKGTLGGITDDNQKSVVENQISGFQAQLGQEEAQKTTLESIKKALEEKKAEFENEKKAAEEKLAALMQEKADLDQKVKMTFDITVNKALDEYNAARTNYYDLMTKAEEEKAAALSEVETARGEVAEVDAKIAEREIEIIQEEMEKQAKRVSESRQGEQMSAVTGNSGSSDAQAANEVQAEQLEKNVKEAQAELTAKENQLYSIYDGTSEEIGKLRTAKDNNFNSFCEALVAAGDASLAGELREAKKNVDSLEKNYLSKCKAVAQFESQLGTAANGIGLISQKITGLEGARTELNNTDRSKLESDQQTKLNAMVSELSAELQGLTNQKKEADAVINDAQKLNKLKEERDKAREEYFEADKALVSKMQQAVNAHSDNSTLSSSMQKYAKSKDEYNNKVVSSVDELTGEISTLRAKVKSLSETLGAAEAKKLAAKYRFGGSGGAIVDIARSFIGKNEADGSADMFWRDQGVNASSRSLPWCAAFVSYVLKQSGVQFEKGDYTYSVTGLKQWGQKNGKYIDGGSANASNVKPGDVVIWKGGYFSSHTGIVSAVYPDGSYDTIEGNYANKVSDNHGNGSTGKYKMARTTGFISV